MEKQNLKTIPDIDLAPDCLAGKVILVTGASAGIGRAVALEMARHGAQLILHGRKVDKLEVLYDEIEALGAPRPSICPLDMEAAVTEDYDALADSILQEFGRLDGLLHNAGILGDKSPIEHYDPVLWQRVMLVNVNAPFLLTRALLPVLKKSEDARILFTSSGVGRTGRAYWGAYAVSKFATEGLMETLADEHENTANLTVNAINPGATRTAMRAKAYPGEDPQTVKTPESLAPSYVWLFSEAARDFQGISFDPA
ncbi:MAG: YciK family oxidoreductase [Gammaproteobacteria bacterium]|nr:YciK family oxidoreductase [Gammaproteobacteria bacterium]